MIDSMTVAQLVKLLQDQPQDAEIDVEGCDCDGGAYGIVFRPAGDDSPASVLICRESSWVGHDGKIVPG